jgi:hypothetical protein
MPFEMARLVITMDDDYRIEVQGTGPALNNKVVAIGLLEMAKDALRTEQKADRLVRPVPGILSPQ